MRGHGNLLINTPEIELWPGGLLRARSNHDARALSRARHVLRRKRDGRFLAADLPEGLLPLVHRLMREDGIDAALDALDCIVEYRREGLIRVGELPLGRLEERLAGLGLDADGYESRTGLALIAEPDRLALAGFDRFRRPLWLHPAAARAWTHLREAAMRDGVVLDAISGYRSHDYQLGIFERKLARGQSVEDILNVNAAPGYSEHHSGLALDIGAPGEPPAEESFEHTGAFAWLREQAGGYGFVMSYPRGNPHGIVYEPWHWRHEPA
ncbi:MULTISPECIES: M15 family metallopeptidase [Lysobacter]|uniref:M15 family metallopeptidase n=1 Tax=Lysobacter TaxID=68 RepID=UPI001F2C264E|nr:MULTISPECIES: M15 family metallopeptidase [Lysobacter]UJB17646.1 D-alanyl-D-alanine carboxypeptidase family protein [Lysobacter capsici]UJQ28632.1 D-alanyl-D-alanine carboxypeptidase family protein [Lysobacter gummosus]